MNKSCICVSELKKDSYLGEARKMTETVVGIAFGNSAECQNQLVRTPIQRTAEKDCRNALKPEPYNITAALAVNEPLYTQQHEKPHGN